MLIGKKLQGKEEDALAHLSYQLLVLSERIYQQ